MKVSNLTLEVGYHCNGSCDYCFQKNYKDDNIIFRLLPDLKKFLIFLRDTDSLSENFSIMIYGGESLLYKDLILRIFEELKKEINFTPRITTNGILLNRENQNWIISNQISPTISIDGGPETQKYHRLLPITEKVFYDQIREFNTIKGKLVSIAQSTITPFTVGELFSSFLVINYLKFNKWWFELECFSEIGKNQWNDIFLEIYKKQIKQIETMRTQDLEILPFIEMDAFLEGKEQEKVAIACSPKGDLTISCHLINMQTQESHQHFSLGSLTKLDSNFFEKIERAKQFCIHSPFQAVDKCKNCAMNGFCIHNNPDGSPIPYQDYANCGFWNYMWRGRYE